MLPRKHVTQRVLNSLYFRSVKVGARSLLNTTSTNKSLRFFNIKFASRFAEWQYFLGIFPVYKFSQFV